MMAIISLAPDVRAVSKETMDPDGLVRNLKDYDLVSDQGKADQSETLQKAIDEVAEQGSGRLVMPMGDLDKTITVQSADKAAVFEVKLPKGEVNMKTWLLDAKDRELSGAYYVDVKLL